MAIRYVSCSSRNYFPSMLKYMKTPIDTYLETQPLEYQKEFERLRKIIKQILPNSTECISYGMPTFKVKGKSIVWFAGFKNHMWFFPFSGSILDIFKEELREYEYTKSSLHFTVEKPLSEEIIEKIIQKKLELLS